MIEGFRGLSFILHGCGCSLEGSPFQMQPFSMQSGPLPRERPKGGFEAGQGASMPTVHEQRTRGSRRCHTPRGEARVRRHAASSSKHPRMASRKTWPGTRASMRRRPSRGSRSPELSQRSFRRADVRAEVQVTGHGVWTASFAQRGVSVRRSACAPLRQTSQDQCRAVVSL